MESIQKAFLPEQTLRAVSGSVIRLSWFVLFLSVRIIPSVRVAIAPFESHSGLTAYFKREVCIVQSIFSPRLTLSHIKHQKSRGGSLQAMGIPAFAF